MPSSSGSRHPTRPLLNDLSGREWVRFTKSWFVANPPRRSPSERSHPAKFPEDLCEAFVRFFTQAGMTVLDPFAGTGSTLVAAVRSQRGAVGLEIHPTFAQLAEERVRAATPRGGPRGRVFRADARDLEKIWRREKLPPVQLVLTSPPYWDMLGKSRGGSRSAHRTRATDGLAITYSSDPKDLGNLHDYRAFLTATVDVLRSTGPLLEPGRYLVVIAQNLRDVDGSLRTLAWDLARELDRPPFQFQGERIWCQDSKPLGIWGFPSTFVPNYHHHYCLIFRRQPMPDASTSALGSAGGARRVRRAFEAPPRDAAG
ncbi:MAG: DNA methyltransferase [Thermoplasmata archaeon]